MYNSSHEQRSELNLNTTIQACSDVCLAVTKNQQTCVKKCVFLSSGGKRGKPKLTRFVVNMVSVWCVVYPLFANYHVAIIILPNYNYVKCCISHHTALLLESSLSISSMFRYWSTMRPGHWQLSRWPLQATWFLDCVCFYVAYFIGLLYTSLFHTFHVFSLTLA